MAELRDRASLPVARGENKPSTRDQPTISSALALGTEREVCAGAWRVRGESRVDRAASSSSGGPREGGGEAKEKWWQACVCPCFYSPLIAELQLYLGLHLFLGLDPLYYIFLFEHSLFCFSVCLRLFVSWFFLSPALPHAGRWHS